MSAEPQATPEPIVITKKVVTAQDARNVLNSCKNVRVEGINEATIGKPKCYCCDSRAIHAYQSEWKADHFGNVLFVCDTHRDEIQAIGTN
jgi:hypothetical protein